MSLSDARYNERLLNRICRAYSIMASKTQAHLIGKPVSSEALDSALDVLGTEFDLAFNVPGGMPSYRKTLALSFLFKFLTTVSVTLDLPLAKSVAASETDLQDIMGSIHRQPSSGRNDNSDPHAKEVVGKSIPHLSGLKHCTGEYSSSSLCDHTDTGLQVRLSTSTICLLSPTRGTELSCSLLKLTPRSPSTRVPCLRCQGSSAGSITRICQRREQTSGELSPLMKSSLLVRTSPPSSPTLR